MSKYNPIDPQRNQAECLNKDISDFVSKAKLNDISEILDFEEEQFPRKEELRTQPVPSLLSMALYYIFLLPGFGNINDQNRSQNINTEII